MKNMGNEELIAELAIYPNGLDGRDLAVYSKLLIGQAHAALEAAQPAKNADVGPRCGECRLGLGSHDKADPYCAHHASTTPPATETENT
jgi:hypothetical protein